MMTKDFSDKFSKKITIIKSTASIIGPMPGLGFGAHLRNHFDIYRIHMLFASSI